MSKTVWLSEDAIRALEEQKPPGQDVSWTELVEQSLEAVELLDELMRNYDVPEDIKERYYHQVRGRDPHEDVVI